MLWWFPQCHYSHDYLASLVLMMLTSILIAQTNAAYHILRVRSYMMILMWQFVATMTTTMHPLVAEGSREVPMLTAFCLAVAYLLLFRTYQTTNPVADGFHIFFMLGVGTLFMPSFGLLVPLFLWHWAVFMRCLSLRTFFAALIGFILPFWGWVSWLLWRENLTPLSDWWQACTNIGTTNYIEAVKGWGASEYTLAAPFLVLVALTLWTTGYYLLNSNDDKIRVRMTMYTYIAQSWGIILLAFVTLNSTSFTPLLLLSLCPFAAHYFTLRTTTISLVVFICFVVAFVIIFVNTIFDLTYILNYFTTFNLRF